MASCRRFDPALTSPDTVEFTFRLQNEKNFIPDVLRDYGRMMDEYSRTMGSCCQPFAMVDCQNKLGGVFFINDVSPGHEAAFYLWIWNPKCYSAGTHRFMGDYIDHCAESNGLSRLVSRTPDDKRLGRLLERLGFKLEGRFKFGYKSGGKLSCLYQYRRLFSGGV